MRKYIESLEDLSRQVGSMDRVVLRPVEVEGQTLKKFQATWNLAKNGVATIVSSSYKEIQHNDVLGAVTETLGRLNLNVEGVFHDFGNRMKADLIFKDGEMVKDDATGIKLGFRVLNSYDKATSFRLEMYGFRVVCKNGMTLGSVMNKVREVTFHTGKEKPYDVICQITEKFVKEVINSSAKLQEYVNRAIGDSIEWEMLDKILPTMIKVEKHREAIKQKLEGIAVPTRWDVYNAVTSYLTHDEHLKPTVQAFLENRAEKLLKKTSEQLMVEIEVI